MKQYTARVRRGERMWLIEVPAIERTTQSRLLRDAEGMARDLIAVMLDVPADSFTVGMEVDLPDAVAQHLAKAQELREAARQANASSAEESRAAARALSADGIPVRDIGVALGVSYQRAHQLVSS